MSTFTVRSGELPQHLINQLNDIPEWAPIKQALAQEAQIDEKIKSVLQKCLENEDFKKGWEKVRMDYGRHPDLLIIEDKQVITNQKFIKVPIDSQTLEILGPPEISLPASFFPVLAITSLAIAIFKLSESTETYAFSKMLDFCEPNYLQLENPVSKQEIIYYKLANLALKIVYNQDNVKPKITANFSISINALSQIFEEITKKKSTQ